MEKTTSPSSLVDWSKLREQIIMALPNSYKEQLLSGEMQSYTISLENPEALNLLGVLEIDTTSLTSFLNHLIMDF